MFTKVYFPTGPGGPNDSGLSRKHLMEGIDGSLRRLGMDYVDMYQAHRFDYQTPLDETMEAFADIVLGIAHIVFSPLLEGVLTGKVPARTAAAGHDLSEETLARIDGVLSDSVSRDATLVEESSPKQR